MALPKFEHPMFEVVVPSTKQKIYVRPYTTKQAKILYMMAESTSFEELIKNIQALVQSCIVQPENYQVGKMTSFDLQYVFLQIRAITVGERVELKYKCQNIVNDEVCNHENDVMINFKEVTVKFDESAKQEIVFEFGNMGVKMRYPRVENIDFLQEIVQKQSNDFDGIIRIIVKDIEYIFDETTKYSDFTEDEALEFLTALPLNDFQKILNFYNNLPTLYYEYPFKCIKCGYEETLVYTSLFDFFV
jgi:hypothetical protein